MTGPNILKMVRRCLGVLLAVGWLITAVLAKVGQFLVQVKSLVAYGLLFVATIFVPPLGLLLVGCMFLWLTRPYWDRRSPQSEGIP